MELTVARPQNSDTYHKALAWLDTRLGGVGSVVLSSVAGIMLTGLWLYLDTSKAGDFLVYQWHLSRANADAIMSGVLFALPVGSVFCLVLAVLCMPIVVMCWAARTANSIVRLHPTVLLMLEYQLGNYSLDNRKGAIRWLVTHMAPQLAKANNDWVNDKQQHGNDAYKLSRVDIDLCDALGLLVSSCKASNKIR